MDESPRVVLIHRSLVRPQLIMGCERFLFLMLCMMVTLIAGPGGLMVGNFKNVIVAFIVFVIGRSLLTYMAKIDPYMSDIFRRSVQYRAEYPACSTVGYKNISKPKRW
jgi:type IV secretory pathway TrbD component